MAGSRINFTTSLLIREKLKTLPIDKKPQIVKEMKAIQGKWVQSCQQSSLGKDYR